MYEIYRNSEYLTKTTDNFYTDTGLTPETPYSYYLSSGKTHYCQFSADSGYIYDIF
jgi:hypothetical protein